MGKGWGAGTSVQGAWEAERELCAGDSEARDQV